jgi:type IV secretory pathway VirB10-like protein
VTATFVTLLRPTRCTPLTNDFSSRTKTTAQLILAAGSVLLAILTLSPVPVSKPRAQPSTSLDPITVQTTKHPEERPPPRIIPLPTAHSASLPDVPQGPTNTVQTVNRETEPIQPLYLPAKSDPLPRKEAETTSQKRRVSFQNYNGLCERYGKRREDYMKNGRPYWRCSR